ncbi:MAG: PIN domain-containing protein [Anaerolineae bacterium]|nr:PIN domain-containing protein [Anaerolineae bacterium]
MLDTNAISDYIRQFAPSTTRLNQSIRDGDVLYLCKPVEYEVVRGLLKFRADSQREIFEMDFVPQLTPLALTDADWRQAAQFWAEAGSAGKQLADVDLLVAALAFRLNAVIVTHDHDFDALPVRCENWRQTLPDDNIS